MGPGSPHSARLLWHRGVSIGEIAC